MTLEKGSDRVIEMKNGWGCNVKINAHEISTPKIINEIKQQL